jgi:hypothetical protein
VGPADHLRNFLLVDALQRDGIDLDCEACGLRGANTFFDFIEIAPAGDLLELGMIKCVHRNVDPAHPMGHQFIRKLGKLAAIGSQRQFFQGTGAQMPPHAFNQRHDALAHQRLAARKPDLANALFNEGRTHPVQLFQREQVTLGQKRHVLGHAIDTAEVATIRHRHAQIADMPAEGINEGGSTHELNLGFRGITVK